MAAHIVFANAVYLYKSRKKAKYLLDLTSMDVYVPQERTDVTKILRTPTPHTLLLVVSPLCAYSFFLLTHEGGDCGLLCNQFYIVALLDWIIGP